MLQLPWLLHGLTRNLLTFVISGPANTTAVVTQQVSLPQGAYVAENVLVYSCETVLDTNGNEKISYWLGTNYFTGTAFTIDLGALVLSGAVLVRNARNGAFNDR